MPGVTTKILAACIALAAQSFDVPPAALLAIHQVEGGTQGQAVENSNGTQDLGPMQINTIWVPALAKNWGVSEDTATRLVRDDVCVNARVAAMILREHWDETKDLDEALAQYHSRTDRLGDAYYEKIFKALERSSLLKVD